MSESIYIKPTHLFMADVHLGGSIVMGENYEQSLCSLISYAAQKKIQLYLLGDVFDYWMEFPAQKTGKTSSKSNQSTHETILPSLGSSVLDTLQKYNQVCGPAYYILGNHDYWDAGYFAAVSSKTKPIDSKSSLSGSFALVTGITRARSIVVLNISFILFIMPSFPISLKNLNNACYFPHQFVHATYPAIIIISFISHVLKHNWMRQYYKTLFF